MLALRPCHAAGARPHSRVPSAPRPTRYTWIVADAVGTNWWDQLVAGLPPGKTVEEQAQEVEGFLQVLPVELADPAASRFRAAWEGQDMSAFTAAFPAITLPPNERLPSIAAYVYDR